MAWSGPQGIKPLSSPTKRGLLLLTRPAHEVRPFGKPRFSLRSHGKMFNMLRPMITMNTPATSWTTPLAAPEKLTTEPRAPTIPPTTA